MGRFAVSGAAVGLFAVGLWSAPRPRELPEKIDFNRDIRSILSKCLACHGPGAGEGAAQLRLDSFAGSTRKLPSGHSAIVPGKPDASELIRRVNSAGDDVMPPKESHKTLSAEEKQLLHEWIAQGAEFKEHWAFVPPVRPALPAVKDQAWPTNDLDYFVLSAIERTGLRPEKEASKETLLRRASLDLTGLPPSPEELDSFLADKSGNAYEKAIDRLLASPRYGERMAMDWMDYARYADSNGYQADYERFQSRWRDWVINAFNANMPYDQFTVEQIAGDLLPNPTVSQKLATAFNRNHRINTEGGVIAEEWRVETVVDRVETTSAVWLGLTAGCARCHDHKYDPLTQKDFYRLYAFFNNVPESGSGEERPINHPPTMKAPTEAESKQLQVLSSRISALDGWLALRAKKNEPKSQQWKGAASLPEIRNGLVARSRFGHEGGISFKAVGDVKFEPGRASGAAIVDEKAFLDLGQVGDFEKDHPFSFGGWVKPEKDGTPFSRMDSNAGFRGWELSIYGGRPQAHLINNWPENGLKIAAKAPVRMGAWTHLLVTWDGAGKSAGFKLYVNGKLAETNVENDTLKETIRTGVTTKIGRRTNSEFFTGAVDDFVLFDRELKPEEAEKLASTSPALPLLGIPVEKRSKENREELSRLWSREYDAEYRSKDEELASLKKERDDLDGSIPAVMVMQEMSQPRDCFVLQRGQYDKPGEKVEAGLPSFLPPMQERFPNNRLGLARWIVSPTNPLTARVTVNRLWERFFGSGIVSTIEDFGTRAEFPTNPELLDYLATELIRLKWDLKAFLKEIVMSSTYRQSSEISAEKLEKDPANRLLARGPRYRLPGEVIRDQALYASGLLVEKLGGPSVYPYMPEGVWDETNFYGNLRNYKHATGSGLYRRSLYTIWKRTAAPPNMLLFDVPSRETCRVHRARTDTPLQALTLMNDETYLEAARVLAQKMMREGGGTVTERLRYGFRRVLSREPSKEELKRMADAYEKRIARFRSDPEAARDLASVGEAKLDMGLNRAELAAYTVAASVLLNLDETVTKE